MVDQYYENFKDKKSLKYLEYLVKASLNMPAIMSKHC
jgi:hypothetical protein